MQYIAPERPLQGVSRTQGQDQHVVILSQPELRVCSNLDFQDSCISCTNEICSPIMLKEQRCPLDSSPQQSV